MKEKGFTKEDTEIAKGIGILVMLLNHLYAHPDRTAGFFTVNTQSIYFRCALLGRICVPAFAMITGYGMYLSFQSGKDQKKLIPSRLKKLYQMVFRIMIIFLPAGICMHVYFLHPFALFLRNLFYTMTGLDPVFNEEWWYLWLYILLVVMAPFLMKMVKKLNAFWNMIFIFLFCMLVTYVLPLCSDSAVYQAAASLHVIGQSIWVLTWELAPFLAGAMLAKYKIFEKIRKIQSSILIPVSCILAGCSAYAFLYWKDTPFIDTVYAMLLLVTVISVFEKIPGLRKLLAGLGDYSGYMWLDHTFFAYYLFPKYVFISDHALVNWIWLILLSYAASYCIRKLFDWLESFISRKKAAAVV